jgi:O-antigen/teichoic acid export membrane protein
MPTSLHSSERPNDRSVTTDRLAVSSAQEADTQKAPDLLEEGLIAGSMHLVRRAGVVLVVQVLGAGLAYGLQVLLARLLGASDFGIYTYVFVWVTFVSLLAGLGFPAASVRFLPVYRVKEDWSRIHGFVGATSKITLLTAIAIALCGAVGAEVLHAIGLVARPSVIVIGALIVPALAGSMLYTEIARAGHRVGIAFVPPQIARPALIGACAAALFLLGGELSATGALMATLAAAYAVLAVQYGFTRHLFDIPKVERQQQVVELREWFGVGINLLIVSVFIITLMQVDIVIVGGFLGARDAGIYAAASKTATLVAFVIMAINAAAAPQFASLWSLGRVDELQRLVTKLAGMIFWPSLAIAVGIGALSGPLLGLFGAEFQTARPALLILLVGQVINAAAGSVGYLLTLTGHHREATRALGLSALACILLAVLGVWAFGLVGAALGSTIGFLLWNGSLYWLVVRKLGIYPSVLTTLRLPRHR